MRRLAGVLLGAAACCLPAASSVQADNRGYQLLTVTLETTGGENYLQFACGPKSVRSHARLRIITPDGEITLRQEDAQQCDGLWGPLWTAQTMHMQWIVREPLMLRPGEHRIEMWDGDWLRGPRRHAASRYYFQDQGKGRVAKLIPEGYILTLTYLPYSVGAPGTFSSLKDNAPVCDVHPGGWAGRYANGTRERC